MQIIRTDFPGKMRPILTGSSSFFSYKFLRASFRKQSYLSSSYSEQILSLRLPVVEKIASRITKLVSSAEIAIELGPKIGTKHLRVFDDRYMTSMTASIS
jgi:hypothetical protein